MQFPDKNSLKPKLLFVVSRFPYPLEKGDKLRAYHQIRELSAFFSITLVAVTGKKISRENLEKLHDYCSSVQLIRQSKWTIFINLIKCLFNDKPFQVGYFYSAKGKRKVQQLIKNLKPDAIYAQLIRTTEYVKDYHQCPKTLDYMDALSKGMERRIEKAPFYLKWLFKTESSRLKRYERLMFDYFEEKTIISDQDRNFIHHPERAKIHCVPNGIDLSYFKRPEQITPDFDLVFVGNLSYPPNVEAVSFLAEILKKADFPLTCLIAGASPAPLIQKICRQHENMQLLGWVDDIRTAYLRGKLFVAPMKIGTGMQNKLLEAMALQIPCITTPLANNAIQAKAGEEIFVADTTAQFITLIHQLLSDQKAYESLSDKGFQFVKTNFDWKKTAEQLQKIILPAQYF